MARLAWLVATAALGVALVALQLRVVSLVAEFGAPIGGSLTIFLLCGRSESSMLATMKSLAAASYAEEERVNVVVVIDQSRMGSAWTSALGASERFAWEKGSKLVMLVDDVGEETWAKEWETTDGKGKHDGLVISDGMVVSPLFAQWIRRSWQRFGRNQKAVVGMSLARREDEPRKAKRFRSSSVPKRWNMRKGFAISPSQWMWREFLKQKNTSGLKYWEFVRRAGKRKFLVGFSGFNKRMAMEQSTNGENNLNGLFQLEDMASVFMIPTDTHSESLLGEDLGETFVSVINQLTNIQSSSKYRALNIQILNEGFVSLTKNWICNTLMVSPEILRSTVFITTDESSYVALQTFADTFGISLHLVALTFKTVETKLVYGYSTYFRFILFRTHLIKAMLLAGLEFLLSEADALWLGDVISYIQTVPGFPSADIVAMQDQVNSPLTVNGGFLYLKPTRRNAYFYNKLIARLEMALLRTKDAKFIGAVGNEQFMMKNLFKELGETSPVIQFLDKEKFVSGQWFQGKFRTLALAPYVILNNFIPTVEKKESRAKWYGMWFLDEVEGRCSQLGAGQTKVQSLSNLFYQSLVEDEVISSQVDVIREQDPKVVLVVYLGNQIELREPRFSMDMSKHADMVFFIATERKLCDAMEHISGSCIVLAVQFHFELFLSHVANLLQNYAMLVSISSKYLDRISLPFLLDKARARSTSLILFSDSSQLSTSGMVFTKPQNFSKDENDLDRIAVLSLKSSILAPSKRPRESLSIMEFISQDTEILDLQNLIPVQT